MTLHTIRTDLVSKALTISGRVKQNAFVEDFWHFISRYKSSNTYWLSAFGGAVYGSINVELVQGWSMELLLLIFFLPPAIFYGVHRPFGLTCSYRPVDRERGIVDLAGRNDNIAQKDKDGWEVDLEIEASERIDKYAIDLNPPPGIEIYFVDSFSDKMEYDDERDKIEVESDRQDNFVAAIYLSESSAESLGSDNTLFVENDSGHVLTEITLVD